MVAIPDVENTSILFAEQGSDPATPASGYGRLFIKSGGVYFMDDSGTVTGPFGAAGGGSSPSLLHVRDEKTAGTAGGTATSGSWQTRALNTTKTNEIAGASLASNQISLPAGTYEADWRAPFFCPLINQRSRARLRDVTNSVTLVDGQNVAVFSNNYNGYAWANGRGRFTLAATATVELQQVVQTTQATNGWGESLNGALATGVEIYSDLQIRKVA